MQQRVISGPQAVGVLLSLSLCLLACGRRTDEAGASSHRAAERANVLVIMLDSCRADKLGCYGYGDSTSPALDKLAREPDSVLFRRHYAERNLAAHLPALGAVFSSAGYFTLRFLDRRIESTRQLDEVSNRISGFVEKIDDTERLGHLSAFLERVPEPFLGYAEFRGCSTGTSGSISDRVYDDRLEQVDRGLVAPLIHMLRESGHYDRTLLLVTADRGAGLRERSPAEADELWESRIHVPLIVKFPRNAKPAALGGEVGALTRAADIMPALLSYLGLENPADPPRWNIFEGPYPDHVLVRRAGGWALLRDDLKLIELGTTSLLFDVWDDPLEQQNLAEQLPSRADALRQLGRVLIEGGLSEEFDPWDDDLEMDPEMLDELRSLGYIQ